MSFLEKIFGDANKKYLEKLQPAVLAINALEPDTEKLADQELKNKTLALKSKVAVGELTLDQAEVECFALVREAAKRTLKQRHFDVQLLGGMVLHRGQIAEMKTGEGKTLTSTLAVSLNALAAQGVHVVTVNDYLAKRDTVWMGQIYDLLGLSVGCIQHEGAFLYDAGYQATEQTEEERDRGVAINQNFLRPVKRTEAYSADITYGTNNEFGFDYLRDNMVPSLASMAQRSLNYAIVDEVDSILIDEARTPLIISGPAEESTERYRQFARIVKTLKENEDYNIDEKLRSAILTEAGLTKVEKALGVDNIYQSQGISTVHHLEAALRAETLFKLDRDYVVKNGEVIIVDEFTGRLMHGRRYSEGLHQAIEAKEGVKVQRESVTLATITFQNYFRMYQKLAGMTGTAATESEEFSKIYNLDVTIIPTNKPLIRKDANDLVYKSELGKFKAVVTEIKKRRELGQPVLLGTISIEKNERLSELLSREGVKHEILNAKNHEREALIIAQAGKKGAVTLATNMAGRGVDIILGGYPFNPQEAEEVKRLGGLHVIGTERHEARRIDNQLRGRSGRQGDPGSSQFFVSLDDDLMRIFGSERIKSIMTTLKVPEDMPIENGLISKSIEAAQKKVEGNNFDIRKHLVEYDDIINKHREVIYRKRRQILELANEIKTDNNEFNSTKEIIFDFLNKEIDVLAATYALGDNPADWDLKEITETVKTLLPLGTEEEANLKNSGAKLTDYLKNLAVKKYQELEQGLASLPVFKDQTQPLANLEKTLLLNTIDILWVEHLEAIDHLRTGIGLRSYGQHDPLVEYKREAYNLFKRLLLAIQNQVAFTIFKIGQAAALAAAGPLSGTSPMAAGNLKFNAPAKTAGDLPALTSKPKDAIGNKIGRNDPCYCGSGKKFKKCHGL